MTRPRLRHALAGLEAGILGTGIMLFWLMTASVLNRRSVWLTPNLFATTFFGPDAYRNAFSEASVAGIALLLAIFGSLGALWGLLWREESRPFFPLYGIAAGLLVYLFFFHIVWKQANPLLTIYAPTRQLQIGHLLWGLTLARSPRYARRIRAVGKEAAGSSEAVREAEPSEAPVTE